MEYNGPERRASAKTRNALLWLSLGLLLALAAVDFYGAFVVGPDERQEIRETAEKAETTADALAKSNAGVTALICTGTNRHDYIDAKIIDVGDDLLPALQKVRDDIPPATNCGELICQFFREIEEPGAEITIDDPYGPDRKLAPCGEAEEAGRTDDG